MYLWKQTILVLKCRHHVAKVHSVCISQCSADLSFFCGKYVFVYYKFMYSLVAEDLAFTDKLTRSQFAVLNVAMTEK